MKTKLPMFTLAAFCLAAPPSDAAPFQNGSFEINGGDSSQTAAGWNVTGNVFFNDKSPYYGSTDGNFTAVFNEFDAQPNGVISQTFDTIPLQLYRVSFDWGTHAESSLQQLQIEVRDGTSPNTGTHLITPGSGAVSTVSEAVIVGNTNIFQVSDPTGWGATPTSSPAPNDKFSAFSFTFAAQSATSTIVFRDAASATISTDAVLDNVQVNVVPEPATTAMVSLALVGLVACRRRRG